MRNFMIASAIDTAYWFIQYADKVNISLDDEKVHQLLFFAQSAFLKKNPKKLLFPSLFVVTKHGFFEPNLLKMFSFGRPFMPMVKLNNELQNFLTDIFNKYASEPTINIRKLIVDSPLHKNLFLENQNLCVCISQIVSENIVSEPPHHKKEKIRLSQNGPVYVSQWNPKKIGK